MPSDDIIDERSAKLIERLVESGRFQSRNEVVREGLLLLEAREEELEAEVERFHVAVQEGIDSGDYKPADVVFKELREKYEKMAIAQRR
ncbi:hypothetical protein BH10PSE7_BH10PSE7_14530 [soil metagenome]